MLDHPFYRMRSRTNVWYVVNDYKSQLYQYMVALQSWSEPVSNQLKYVMNNLELLYE